MEKEWLKEAVGWLCRHVSRATSHTGIAGTRFTDAMTPATKYMGVDLGG